MAKEDKLAQKYFLDQNYNCAETVLLVSSERYGLGLSADDVRLLSGFGGGMNCGKACGAIAGAVAVLSRLSVTDRAHTTEGFHDLVGGLVRELERVLGSTECDDLVKVYRKDGLRCMETVEITLEVLERYLKDHQVIA